MYGRTKVNTLPGYENVLDVYEIDRYGNVYGKNGNELKKCFNQANYLCVSLNVNGKRTNKRALVHRLVALAFVDGYSEINNEVDHKDCDKLNNNYWNLRWCDHSGNMQNPITKQKQKSAVEELLGIPCYVYDFRLNYIGYFKTKLEAENAIGRSIHNIDSRVCEYYILSEPDLSKVLKINRKQKLQSVVITDITTFKKYYFYSNREARRFFDNKVNITDAIKNNWTVRGKYKVRSLNYKKLIGMLDL